MFVSSLAASLIGLYFMKLGAMVQVLSAALKFTLFIIWRISMSKTLPWSSRETIGDNHS